MNKPHLVLGQDDAFEALGGSRFKKDVVRIGKWIHPATGQEIKFDAARLARLALHTEKYRQSVDKEVIPFPDGHSFRAQDNIGGARKFRVEGDRLMAEFEPAGADVEEKLSSGKIRSVSAYIEFNVKDSKGNVYPEAITHVAATPYPVVTGQEDFVKLSSKDDAFDFYIPEAVALAAGGFDVLKTHDHLRKELQDRIKEHKDTHDKNGPDHADTKAAAGKLQDAAHRLRRQAEVIHSHTMNATGGPTYMSNKTEGLSPEGNEKETDMILKPMALALGLPETATAEQVEAAAVKRGVDLKLALDGLQANGLKLEGDKVVKLSAKPEEPQTEREKALAAENAALKGQQALAQAVAMSAKVQGLITSGIVEPAKAEILSRLMSVPAKVKALALSKDAKGIEEVQVDVAADVEALLTGLPGVTTQRLAAGQGDDTKTAEALTAKKVDAIAERTQPELAAKK